MRPERSTWPLVIAGYVTVAVIDEGPSGGVTWLAVATTAALAGAVAGSSRSSTGLQAHLAAGIATVAGALALAAAGVDPGTSVVAACLVGVGLSGLAAIDRRLPSARPPASWPSTIAVIASGAASPVFASIAVTVLGAQASPTRGRPAAGGCARRSGADRRAPCQPVVDDGHEPWMIDGDCPYGADGGDVAIAAAMAGLLVGGWLRAQGARRRRLVGLLPGLGHGRHVAVASQLEAGTDWATFGALAVGIARARRRRDPAPRRTARARHR